MGDSHGCVLIYVQNNIHYRRRRDLEILGLIRIELSFKHKRVLFGLFYRPPNSDQLYNDYLEDYIHLAIDTVLNEGIITGDLNFNNVKSTVSSQNDTIYSVDFDKANVLNDFFCNQTMLNDDNVSLVVIEQLSQTIVLSPGVVGGTLNFSSYVGSGPASTPHLKKYQEFQAPQKLFEILATKSNSRILHLDLKKRP